MIGSVWFGKLVDVLVAVIVQGLPHLPDAFLVHPTLLVDAAKILTLLGGDVSSNTHCLGCQNTACMGSSDVHVDSVNAFVFVEDAGKVAFIEEVAGLLDGLGVGSVSTVLIGAFRIGGCIVIRVADEVHVDLEIGGHGTSNQIQYMVLEPVSTSNIKPS